MHLESTLSALIKAKKINNYILCFVIQKDRNAELPLNKAFCKFIGQDLTAFLAQKFGTIASKENFVFCGQSFGGLTALGLEMYCPNTIGTIICQSASLWFDKQDVVLAHFCSHLPSSKFYYSYGIAEQSYITEKGSRFKELLKHNPNCKFNTFAGGHDYLSWQDDLIETLKSFCKYKTADKTAKLER